MNHTSVRVLALSIFTAVAGACSAPADQGSEELGGSVDSGGTTADAGASSTDSGFASFDPSDASTGGSGECKTASDCDDRDPCTEDICEIGTGSEFKTGRCGYAPKACGSGMKDAGPSDAGKSDTGTMPPPVVELPPIETCAPGCDSSKRSYPPAAPLVSTVPSTCTSGFEINNPAKGVYTINSKLPGGAPAGTLEVQFATYVAPDHIKLVGVTAAGEYPLVDTCTVQTATYSDPTGGCTRPPDDSIRQLKVTLRAGTTALKVDVSGSCTPIYLRVRGLCRFDVKPFYAGCGFRVVP